MVEEFKLIIPGIEYAQQIREFKLEFIKNNSSMDGCSSLSLCNTPEEFILNCIKYSSKDTVPSFLLPTSLFMMIRLIDNRLIGMIDIRHYLNDYLYMYGGNIGFSIRPTERGKKYSNLLLKLGLIECEKLCLNTLLITCNEDNLASEKAIQNNDGIYQNTVFNTKTQKYVKRYIINLN